jgi:hypothetical protein
VKQTIVLFFLAAQILLAQEAEYRIGDDGRFVQTLRWREQENVLYYRIEIEKQEEAGWGEAVSGETEAAAFELSLPPGNYRYRVQVYDFLGKLAGTSEWIHFAILPARQPELIRFSPEAFYLDEDPVWVLDLYGRGLTDGIEVFLQGPWGRIYPDTVSVEQSEREVRLVFSYERLDTGEYTVHVINPGGLTAEVEPFRIVFKKPVDINISAGYKPLVPLYGEINDLFESDFFPLGAYGCLGVVPFKRRWGYLGFELEPAWNYFSHKGNGYEVQAHMAGGTVYGLYQLLLPNRTMALNFRLGGGIHSVLNYHFAFNSGTTEPMTVLIPAISAGFSFQWYIRKPFFLEAGLDFSHLFSKDEPGPAYLRPFLGAGRRF